MLDRSKEWRNSNLLGNEDTARRRELSLGIIVGDDFIASKVASRAGRMVLSNLRTVRSRGSATVALGITLNLLAGWRRNITVRALRARSGAPAAIQKTTRSLGSSGCALVRGAVGV
jgi:hypothetical protein